MAVTRIKSNQITDGAVTNVKVADYSIQGGKLANSFTYGSDFTVSGNLTVNGTTTTVDTVTTTIDDPILLLASNQSGNGSVDIGILGERGDDTNVFMGYDESADEFVMALTSTGDSNSAVTVTDYVTTHVGGLTVDDNATVAGTATVTGNITGGNLTTAGLTSTATLTTSGEATLASATVSDLTAGRMVYVTGSGELSDQANLTFNGSQLGTPSLVATGAVTGATMTATGNITGGNLLTGNVTIADSTISAAGDVTLTANGADFITFYGNVDAGNGKGTFNNVQAQTVQNAYGNLELYAGSGSHVKVPTGNSVVIEDIGNTHIVYSNNGELEGGAGLTYNGTEIYADNGNIGGYLAVTGNVSGGNVTTAGQVSATGAVSAGGDMNATNINLTADAYMNNLRAYEGIDVGAFSGGNVKISNVGVLTSSGASSTFTGNVSVGNLSTTGLTSTGDLTVLASGTVEFNQNVLGNVATPSATTDAATKGYVDNLLSSGFTISDGANNTQTIAQGDTMLLNGTSNEIEVTVGATDTVTIGLPDDVEVTGDLTVGGNLVVQGSQTIVDATSTSIVDPIIQLGRGANNAALVSNDGKDRGVAMYYYSGSEKVAFFGFDDPSDEFRFIPDATISSESVTGSLGTANLGRVLVDNVDINGNGITTTSGDLELTSTTNAVAVPSGVSLTVGGNLLNSALTIGRMVYVGTNGQLVDQANLTFNGSQLGTPSVVASGAITAGTTITATGNITGGNLTTAGDVTTATVTASGNVSGGNLTTAGQVSATGAVSAGGDMNATNINLTADAYMNNLRAYEGIDVGAFSGGNVKISNVGVLTSSGASSTFTGNVSVGGTLSVTGESTLASAVVSDLTAGRVTYAGASGALQDSANLTYNGVTLSVPALSAVDNVTAALAMTAGTTITANGNVTGGNLTTAGDVTTATVTASGAITSDTVTGSGNISGGNLLTGNVTVADADITATGVIQGANVTATDTLTGGNVKIAGDSIYVQTGTLVINEFGNDVDFRIEGDNNANLVYVNAGLDNVGIGGIPTNGNCTLCIESTDAIKLPVGTTAERPTGAAGMIRYNSSTDQVEGWDVSEGQFKALGVPAFTTIASESFNGDGSTTGFTLGSDQTTASCIVSINGVVQLPTSAYSVTGNALTFTEAPETGDTIEVRQITTTTTVASLSNGDQSVTIECGDSQVDITGDVVVTGNLTFSGQNFLGQYNHSNVYVVTSGNETTNTGSTLALTAATLGFDLTQASYYQVFMNRQLLRPDEITVNLTNGTITFASDTVAENDEIEAVFLAT